MPFWELSFVPMQSTSYGRSRALPCSPVVNSRSLDLLFGKLQLRAQRIGEAVGQVDQADQQIEVDNLLVGELRLQAVDVGVADGVRIAG